MNDADKALATVKGLDHLLMEGRGIKADLVDALNSATVNLSVTEAPTLVLGFDDAHRKILQSGIYGKGVKTNVDGHPFECTQVAKSGSTLTVTLEHEVSMALRRHTSPVKAAPGTTTHVAFAKRLVSEEKWIQFKTGGKPDRNLVALTRGTPAGSGKNTHLKAESTWDCLGRMATDRGWWRFVVGASELYYVPSEYLFGLPSAYTLREHTSGVDNIDFDYDAGKPVATATVQVRSALWKVPPGQLVTIADCGVVDGNWLVAGISRSLFTTTATVTLQKPQPTLPEPKPQAKSKSSSSSSSGGSTASVSSATSATGGAHTANDFVNVALGEAGKPYVWGGESPSGFDCSGLVQWSCTQLGVSVPRVSGDQWAMCSKAGTLIPVDKAEHVRGALLFGGVHGAQHVAISLGDGRTIEAMGTAYGTGVFNAVGRPWTSAGLIPDFQY